MNIDERYSRQILFHGIGEEGQAAARPLERRHHRVRRSRRDSGRDACPRGRGHPTLVDRDFVEESTCNAR